MADMKLLAKSLAYHCGVLGTYHRFRNRNKLTIAMFHRVLPSTDPRYPGADPEWTMTPESFRTCLKFFQRHYQVITPTQLFSALHGERKLPEHSLLITFDDGWSDTAEYAQPILDKFSMQALIFVAGAAINQELPFWEEHVYSFLATHPDGMSELQGILKENGVCVAGIGLKEGTEENIRQVIRQLGEIDRTLLLKIVSSIPSPAESRPAMLTADQLAGLVASSHVIGGHGMTHQPLTHIAKLDYELGNAQKVMSGYLGKQSIDSMSFPHGAYSEAVIESCRAANYRYLFSSDAHLIPMDAAFNPTRPLGRIHLSEREFTDSTGRFQPALLATWLFLRPSASVK